MHDRLGSAAAFAFHVAGQGGQHLSLCESAFVRIVVAGDDGQIGFAIDVGTLAVRAPGEVAWACAFRD